ncbi:MAG: ABC transporter substrate-binding protein [Chloroflexota bacterium]|nr:ABC transporter substrate-binding protein [Chloroflexota bacterium]MDE2959904.1 ABC transporter substrate-binding protein [Chloroflexota bacterium]
MGLKRYFNLRLLAALGLGAGLIAAVACGGASEAPAAPAAAPTAAPASAGSAAPTAMPEAAQPAAMAEETGGHVNLLVTNIGNGKFDPLLTEGEDLKFQRIFGVALVGGAGGSELVPAVAKDWSVSEDGKVWTFTVNDGFIEAHDGNVITRDDVFFNLDSRLGAEAQTLLESTYYEPRDVALTKLIDGVSKGPADDQVQVIFNTVRLDFSFNWSENAQGASPMIVPEATMRERAGATGFEGYETDPIGVGSMRVTDFVLEQKYSFEKFDNFFWTTENGFSEDRSVTFDTLTIEVVPEPAGRLAALRSGDAQLIEANINMIGDINGIDGASIAWQKESSYNWVVYVDCWEESLWCFPVEARQAAEHAIDKDAIVNGLYSPESVNADSWAHVTPNSLGWGENLRPRPFDLERSKELLKSIGYGGANGDDGTDANGEQIAFTLYTWEAGDLPLLPDLAQLYKDFWTELGWDVEVTVGDAAATRQKWNNREYPGDVLVRTNEGRYDGTSITQGGFLNEQIAWRAVGNWENEPWANTTTPIVQKGLSDLNASTRAASYNAMYDYLQDQTYWGDGFNTNVPWGLGADVASYEPWSLVPYVTAIWTLKLK